MCRGHTTAAPRGERALDPLGMTAGEHRMPEQIARFDEDEGNEERDDEDDAPERLPQGGHQEADGGQGVHAHVHEEQR